MASSPDQKCSRCGATGHLAAVCKVPFQRSLCSFCGRLGHVASNCAAKRKAEEAERAQQKVEREARREEQRQARKKEVRMEQEMLWKATVWCWHCGGLGHVKADCAKLFNLKLERERAGAAKDDDACSESTVATATDKVWSRQKGRPLASPISGCHYCGAEGHTARECQERLVAKERSSALRARATDADERRTAATATVHKKFEPKELDLDFPELPASVGAKDPMHRRAQRKGKGLAQDALVPDAADCELNGMD